MQLDLKMAWSCNFSHFHRNPKESILMTEGGDVLGLGFFFSSQIKKKIIILGTF